MSVLEEVGKAHHHPRRCLLHTALEALPESEAAEFRLVIFDPRYTQPPDFVPASKIAAAFNRRGWKISGQMIQRHREKRCRCPEGTS